MRKISIVFILASLFLSANTFASDTKLFPKVPNYQFKVASGVAGIYLVYESPKELGACVAMMDKRVEMGDNDAQFVTSYTEYYKPEQARILEKFKKAANICGSVNDDACIIKNIGKNDADYITSYVNMTKVLAQGGQNLDKLRLEVFGYCGESKQM